MPALIDIIAGQAGRRSSPMAAPDRHADTGAKLRAKSPPAARTLLGLWGDAGASCSVHMAFIDEDSGHVAVVSLECPDGTFPSVGALHPPAIRLERHSQPLRAGADRRAGHAALARSRLLGRANTRSARARRHRMCALPTRFLPVEGEACIRSRRPGACRHHRAGTFPLHRRARPWCGSNSAWATCTRASSR
jgi:hypothetical protein